MFKYVVIAFCIFSLVSCGGDYSGEIEDYLEEKGLTAQSTDDGLYYIIDAPGNEVKPKLNGNVKVIYKGYLLDGTVFDQSTSAVEFNLSQVIAGWTRGIPLFGEGGKGKLIIPPCLGYGDTERTNIPANSVLVFDVELVEVL